MAVKKIKQKKQKKWHNMTVQAVVKELKTDLAKGLSEEEVLIRQKFGKNILPKEKPLSRLKIFLAQMKSPLIYILIGAGMVTLFLREWTDTIVIFAAVVLNTNVGYFQEKKASDTLRKLKEVLKVKAFVFREGQEKEIIQDDLAPGDVIILKSGNKVPADCRIVEAWNLKIGEAVLTGEWLPSSKSIRKMAVGVPLADRDNMAFMGTMVEDGEGKAVVVSIGKHTEIGKVAALIKETKEEKTPYQKKLSRFSKIIGVIIGVISFLIFVEGMLRMGHLPFLERFREMFTTAVAVAVAAVPEGLPVAMTVILAIGMQRVLKRKGLVRKLASAETLGSTSIIATDKTLTLTEGKMEVAEIKSADKALSLKIGALANEAFVEEQSEKVVQWKVRGRPTDKALLLAAAQKGLEKPILEKEFPRVDFIPFNTKNKFIAALHQSSAKKIPESYCLYVAGAPEKMIELSCKYKSKDRQKKITKVNQGILQQQLETLTSKGLRVVGVAYKIIRTEEKRKIKIQDEVKDLIFVGFIGLHDPLRPEAKEAFAICQSAGMKPIIVTGDHLLTAKAVAKELGLKTNKDNVMLGQDLDKLSDQELAKKLKQINIFARVEPSHKLRIIDAWQKQKQVVAMTGDGINDAPALKKADIGVALGSGTDVAKDVSDLVLLNDNFSIVVAAVEEGRGILDNIRKVITYLLSDSFTEMILIAFAIIARMPLPITAVQILWVNLLEDGFPSIALAFEPKEKDLMSQKPQNHALPLLTKEMKFIIFAIGILTDLLLLGMFLFLYHQVGKGGIDYIRTMIFAGLTVDSLFYVFACKSLRKNIWKINIFSNKYLIAATTFGFLALLASIYLPFLQNLLGTLSLSPKDWLILFGLGVANLILIETAKYYFISRRLTNE